jgi:hypothetical protein
MILQYLSKQLRDVLETFRCVGITKANTALYYAAAVL